MKSKKFGKTRKDIRWKGGEFVFVERVRKQSESEDEVKGEKNEEFTKVVESIESPRFN